MNSNPLPQTSTATPENPLQLDSFVEQLFTADLAELKQRQAEKETISNFSVDLQKQSAQQSKLLQEPLREMAKHGDEGGAVAQSLIDLKLKVEDLNPRQLDLAPGWFTRLIGKIPGVGTPAKRYFSKYESAQTVIQAILRSLEEGRDQLKRDNVTLGDDQKIMNETALKLDQAVKLGQELDQKLAARATALPASDERRRFIEEEFLFPLRQRILDLQQQLAVQQQGVLALELILRNNRELIRGVDRSLGVTVSALSVGATIALALNHQKTTLETVESVNRSTSDLIAANAARLKTQGVEIQKRASSATLDIESLKSAFRDIETAMNDIAQYRVEALPKMAASILEMDRLSQQAEQNIRKLEKGNQTQVVP